MALSPFERGRKLSEIYGWAIFPLYTRTSWSPITGNGHKAATNNEDQIAKWMNAHPTANYGVVPMLSGLVVVDLDRNHADGADGVAAWLELLDKHNGGKPIRTFTVRTPGDGIHLYFLDPGFSPENRPKGRPTAGIDIKYDGFVCGPGSIRDERTRDNASTQLGGEYKITSHCPPADMPEWLKTWLSKTRTDTSAKLDGPAASDADTVRRVVQMARMLSNVPEGGASDWINTEATKIGQYIAAGQISKDDVLVRFSRALRGWTGFEDVMSHIERQLTYGMGLGPRPWMANKPTAAKPDQPKPVSKSDDGGAFSDPDADDIDQDDESGESEVDEAMHRMEINMLAKRKLAAKYRTSKPVAEQRITAAQLKDLPQPEPLIDHIMSRGASTLLYAGTNVGKSVVALDMAMCVATGHPWLDRFDVHHGRVLWIAGEGVYSLRGRMKAWQNANNKSLRLSGGHVFDIIPNSIVFASEEQVAETVAMVHEGQYDLVVIDTLAMNSVGFNENAPVEMTAWWNEVIKLRSECPRLAILVLHHEGKGTANQNTTFKEPRGATSIKDVPETVIRLSLADGSKTGRDIEITKQRDMPSLGKRICIDIESEPKSHEPYVLGKPDPETDEDGTLRKDNARTKLMRYFHDNFSETGVTQSKLYAMVTEEDIIKRSTFYNAVNQLIKDKELVSTKRGNGVFLQLRGRLDDHGDDDL